MQRYTRGIVGFEASEALARYDQAHELGTRRAARMLRRRQTKYTRATTGGNVAGALAEYLVRDWGLACHWQVREDFAEDSATPFDMLFNNQRAVEVKSSPQKWWRNNGPVLKVSQWTDLTSSDALVWVLVLESNRAALSRLPAHAPVAFMLGWITPSEVRAMASVGVVDGQVSLGFDASALRPIAELEALIHTGAPLAVPGGPWRDPWNPGQLPDNLKPWLAAHGISDRAWLGSDNDFHLLDHCSRREPRDREMATAKACSQYMCCEVCSEGVLGGIQGVATSSKLPDPWSDDDETGMPFVGAPWEPAFVPADAD